MRFIKAFVLLLAISLVALFFVPGFSQAKGKDVRVIASGVIQDVGVTKGFKYISVNAKRILLTPGTTVVDTKGKRLTFEDLKLGREVTVELRGDDSRMRKRIIVK